MPDRSFLHLLGLWILSVSAMDHIYGAYTAVFGITVLLFALGLWIRKSWGWFGTVFTLLFVIVADALTLLNLPSIPGIPKLAATAEIGYRVIVLFYLRKMK